MKITRMLGIALIAAIAATALIAAPGATAKPVQLCKVKANNCSPANEYGVGTKIKASLQPGTTMNLTGSLPVECAGSSAGTEITELGGHQAIGAMTSLSFSNCSVFGFIPCKAEVVQLDTAVHITQDTSNLGDGYLYVGPNAGDQPGLKVECTGIDTCVYKTTETQPDHSGSVWAKLAISGGLMAKIVAPGATMKLSTGNLVECGATTSLAAAYGVTEPDPLYVVHQE